MDVITQYGNTARLLSPSAQEKVHMAVPRFVLQTLSLSDSYAIHLAALDRVRPAFPIATGQQLDGLALYLVATAAAQEGSQEKLATMNEMIELMQMRIQLYMERRAKFYETLSNLPKKVYDTQQGIIQNLK